MAQKDLHHRITGDSSSLERASERGSASMSRMAREARRLEREQEKLHRSMETVGRGMLIAGAAIAAGLALSVRAAVEWESAWAGVLKTVDGTDEQMAALEEEIRSLTGVLPASHREIAAVAEAAGQLGVQRENIAGFTKTMIDMGEATNLSSDEAATALARFMNIMQTAPRDVDRLASAIVDLGNKGATTESEITEMALRIAGAGRTIGLSEQQVVGFAAALSNVGIRAEAGGTAISKVFLEIDTAVSAGGENLEVFAETAGMTAEEFRQAYEQDAGAAIASFVAGLAKVQSSGGDVNAILSELGITEIRVSDALRRLAGSGDNLAKSLRTGATAWEENTALATEAERRYATTAAQLDIARNQLNDFAISMGQMFLPVLADAAGGVGGLAETINGLPGPLKTTIAVLAVLVAGVLLAGGAFLTLAPRIVRTKAALQELGVTARFSGTRLGAVASAAGRAAGAIGILAGISLGLEATVRRLEPDVEALAAGLQRWAATGKASGEVAKLLGEDFKHLDGALVGAADEGVTRVTATIAEGLIPTTKNLDSSLARSVERVEAIDSALAGMVQSGRAQEAADVFDVLAQRAEANGISQEKLVEILPAYAAAQEVANSAAGDAVDELGEISPAAEGAATALGLTADEAGTLTDEVEDLDQALKALLGIMFGVEEAQDAAAQALRRVVDAAKENKGGLDGNSEAALTNRDNVRALIDADFDLINAMHEADASADELTEASERLKQKFIEQMRQAGFSEEAVERYAEAYDLIPSEVSTRVSTPGLTEAERRLRNLRSNIDAIPRRVGVTVTASVGSQRIAGLQHGGEIDGSLSAPVDSRLIAATPGEIMIRRSVAQENRAALLALNATGHWPVGGGGRATGASGGLPEHFTASAVIDLGAGIQRRVAIEFDRHDRELDLMVTQGTGAAR